MAQMIPADPPSAQTGLRAERALFEALRDGLPSDYIVYYSLHYLGDRANQGEVDFLIVHRERGMLVLECKGGGVELRPNGRWVRVHQGRETPMHSPFEQAQKQMHTLVRELGDRMRARFPLVHGYAVAFPFARARDFPLPLDARTEIVLTADDLGAIGRWVERALTFWRAAARTAPPAMSPAEFNRFRRQHLHPELRLIETLGARLKVESAAIERLTDEQLLVLKGCLECRRLRVAGGAGSGKTALALEAARRYAREPGQSVLLICYNRMLAAHLAMTVGGWGDIGGKVDVTTFHALCRRAFDALGVVYEPPNETDAERARKFWEEEAPETLLEALAAEALPRYDAIVVDEAQDFRSDWTSVLEDTLKDREKGSLIVFYDPGQRIFDRKSGLSDIPQTWSLTVNFRNARGIVNVVKELGGVEMEPHPRAPEGEPPTVHAHAGPAKTRAQVDDLVRRLIEKNGVTAEQITVLTPHRRDNSSLKGATELGGVALAEEPQARDGKVLHTTIGAFKGLESDVVILVDIDPADTRCDRRARYVAASRAKLALHVYAKGEWLSP
ncbi:MAG: NERD domain-containing protein [Labilithrix sp.]|nr:NERD domain-containing protein [Labilithrix sp.]MCW5815786.1 NERD domain-containing protein [Labilithrix sp.]